MKLVQYGVYTVRYYPPGGKRGVPTQNISPHRILYQIVQPAGTPELLLHLTPLSSLLDFTLASSFMGILRISYEITLHDKAALSAFFLISGTDRFSVAPVVIWEVLSRTAWSVRFCQYTDTLKRPADILRKSYCHERWCGK